jgi:hypothetical protein
MATGWIEPIELLLLLVAAMPAMLIFGALFWRERIWERRRPVMK